MFYCCTFPHIGLPSPVLFQTPSYSVQEYDRDNVTIRVLWQPPQDDSGAPVVNYTVTVSPGLAPLTTSATSAHAMVTIPYNVEHTVSIVATNCNGSNSAVMETISAIGAMATCVCIYGQYVFSHSSSIYSYTQ